MTSRKIVFTPLVEQGRTKFVNSWHLSALKVLAELDRLIHDRPGTGTETSKRGLFVQKVALTVSPNVFFCEVAYSFNDRAIRWEAFDWKVIKASPPRPKPENS